MSVYYLLPLISLSYCLLKVIRGISEVQFSAYYVRMNKFDIIQITNYVQEQKHESFVKLSRSVYHKHRLFKQTAGDVIRACFYYS